MTFVWDAISISVMITVINPPLNTEETLVVIVAGAAYVTAVIGDWS